MSTVIILASRSRHDPDRYGVTWDQRGSRTSPTLDLISMDRP
jgi:hypothetical protein